MPEQAAEPKIQPLRAFKLMRSQEYPQFAVLELATPDGTIRYGVTRDILETLASNMTDAAGKMPARAEGKAAAPAAGAKPAGKKKG